MDGNSSIMRIKYNEPNGIVNFELFSFVQLEYPQQSVFLQDFFLKQVWNLHNIK